MSTVTSKGQVTVPKAVRDYLGLGPGSKVEFRRAADGNVIIAPEGGKLPPSRFRELLGHAGPGPTTDEMMQLLRGD